MRGEQRGCAAELLPADPVPAGRLQRALSRCPQLFHVPRKRLEAAVRLLRDSCLFTAEQLREVLGTCPAVLLEEPRTLHHQFQVSTEPHLPARTGCGNRAVPDTSRSTRSTPISEWGSSRRRW